MKYAKKLASLLLALVMVLALTATAFAEGETGSITVDNPKTGLTYTAYKIFDVVYNADKSAYAYTIKNETGTGGWFNDVLLYMGGGTTAATATNGVYSGKGIKLTPTASDNTVYVVEFTNGEFSAPAFVAFLKGKTEGKTGNPLTKAEGETVAKAANLPLGYYFVTSTDAEGETGALCNLTTTNADVTIHDKNDVPFDKVDDQDSVDVGEIVTYTITGKVPDTTGFSKFDYVITDKMSEGLTLDKTSIKIYISDDDELVTEETAGKTVDSEMNTSYYTKTVDGAKSFDNTVDVDFKIEFKAIDMNKANPSLVGKYIFITYTAKVNEKAVAVVSNNEAILTYSNDPANTNSHGTQTDKETVYSAKINILKVDAKEENKKLGGAKFVLYKEMTPEGATEATKYYYYYDETAKTVSWNALAEGETLETVLKADYAGSTKITQKVTAAETGEASFDGLKNGTYQLLETEAPAGYNRLAAPQAVTIEASVTKNTEGTFTSANLTQEAKVGNNAGSILPDTGGIGTTIFYVLGSTLLLGAAVLLITKKRMSAVQ